MDISWILGGYAMINKKFLYNKTGISNIILLLIISVSILLASAYLAISLFSYNNDEMYMEKSSVAFYEWRKIVTKTKKEIKEKEGKTFSETSIIHPKYKIETKYGNIETFDSKEYIPVEITITSNVTKPYILKRDFYFHQSMDEFVGNMSNNDIGMKWFANEQILRFIADGKEIKEKGENNFSNGDGYILFDNGLMMQWGTVVTKFDWKTHNVWFPKKFPNECMTVVTSVYQNWWVFGIRYATINQPTDSHFSFYAASKYGGPRNLDYKVFWLAIGH